MLIAAQMEILSIRSGMTIIAEILDKVDHGVLLQYHHQQRAQTANAYLQINISIGITAISQHQPVVDST